MVQWVYERAKAARGVDRVCVATDDERVASAVRGFGGEAILTAPEIASGTDRVAAVADQVPGEVFVNVQGDEPLLVPEAIQGAVELVTGGGFPIGTAMTALKDERELLDPSVVKVLADRQGRAIYFSRLPIPYSRGPRPGPGQPFRCFRHVGLYAYRRETLMAFRALPPSAIEQAEVLEQLRALEAGIPIGVAHVDFQCVGVDTPEDLERARALLKP
jgi:3-deoxy-manno-octulosonate cytidylyltransferase (CMP-KDO synthetase)